MWLWIKRLFYKPTKAELWQKVLNYYSNKYVEVCLCPCIYRMYLDGFFTLKEYQQMQQRINKALIDASGQRHATFDGRYRLHQLDQSVRREVRQLLIRVFIRELGDSK